MGGDSVGEKVLGGNSALEKLKEDLAVAEQRLGGRGMRNQMGFWDLHLESITYNELPCFILCEIYIPSLY